MKYSKYYRIKEKEDKKKYLTNEYTKLYKEYESQ